MREMQRDLEAANKTCRILQFKLRKAERRFEQVEAERASLEERLSRLESQLYGESDMNHIRTLEVSLKSPPCSPPRLPFSIIIIFTCLIFETRKNTEPLLFLCRKLHLRRSSEWPRR